MTQGSVIELLVQMLSITGMLVGPILGVGMAVGLVIAVFQAATQIQESSLSFVPKLAAMGGVLIAGGPWALDRLVSFFETILDGMALLGPGVGG